MVASVFFVARGGGNIVVLLNLAMTCWWMGKARAELSSTGAVSVVSVLVTSSLKLGVFSGLAYLMAIASLSVPRLRLLVISFFDGVSLYFAPFSRMGITSLLNVAAVEIMTPDLVQGVCLKVGGGGL